MDNSEEYTDLDELLPTGKKGKKRDKLLQQLRDIEEYDAYDPPENSSLNVSSFLPSSFLQEQPRKKDKEEKKQKETEEEQSADEWFSELVAFRSTMNVSGHGCDDLFEPSEEFGRKKKRKKKKKDKNQPTDYKKEFEPDVALLRNLLIDQNRFTETLQRQYDQLTSVKSSARGANKALTDLVANITSARALSRQLVKDQLDAKKLIADLTLKERKELGLSNDDVSNMSEFASTYLKKMLSERKNLVNTDSPDVGEYSDSEIYDVFNERLSDYDDKSDEAELYVKYESRNPTTYAVVNEFDDSDYEFVTKDSEGVVIDDYPPPNVSSLTVNHSTMTATDNYGEKYEVIWK